LDKGKKHAKQGYKNETPADRNPEETRNLALLRTQRHALFLDAAIDLEGQHSRLSWVKLPSREIRQNK